MLKKLARLFLLHEPEAPELGEPVWRQSALRIILISGICLEFLVAAHSSWQAIGLGLYHIPIIVTGFYLLLAAAIYAALRKTEGVFRIRATVPTHFYLGMYCSDKTNFFELH